MFLSHPASIPESLAVAVQQTQNWLMFREFGNLCGELAR